MRLHIAARGSYHLLKGPGYYRSVRSHTGSYARAYSAIDNRRLFLGFRLVRKRK